MHINFCGINLAHDKSFLVSRPGGSGDNLFIYTRTPFFLVTEGKVERFPAETAVFFRKGRPQHFMAAGNIYADDFIHFDADEEDLKFIDSLEIPSGTAFTDLDTSMFLNIHRYLCIEHSSQTFHSDIAIDCLLRYFLIKLAQSIKEMQSLVISSSTKAALRELRSEMYAHVEQKYTVEALAARVGLSPSYFQAIYKKMFECSCIRDIIQARLERARTLLLTTDKPISVIAHMCGYESESHFARQFKNHFRLTASEFRKQEFE